MRRQRSVHIHRRPHHPTPPRLRWQVVSHDCVPLAFALRSFKVSKAEKIIKAVLEEKLQYTNERDKKGRLTWSYDADECRELSQDITADILEQIKAEAGGMPRYKLICQASVGENNGQSMRMASRCLWDKDFDTCASVTWTNVRRLPCGGRGGRGALSHRSTPARAPPRRTGSTPWRCASLCTMSRDETTFASGPVSLSLS